MNFKTSILRYWLAMNASAFDAAAHAVVVFFGLAGGHAVVASIQVITLQQFAAVFLVAFGRGILAYLEAHPVANLIAPPIAPNPEPKA